MSPGRPQNCSWIGGMERIGLNQRPVSYSSGKFIIGRAIWFITPSRTYFRLGTRGRQRPNVECVPGRVPVGQASAALLTLADAIQGSNSHAQNDPETLTALAGIKIACQPWLSRRSARVMRVFEITYSWT